MTLKMSLRGSNGGWMGESQIEMRGRNDGDDMRWHDAHMWNDMLPDWGFG